MHVHFLARLLSPSVTTLIGRWGVPAMPCGEHVGHVTLQPSCFNRRLHSQRGRPQLLFDTLGAMFALGEIFLTTECWSQSTPMRGHGVSRQHHIVESGPDPTITLLCGIETMSSNRGAADDSV